MQYCTLKIAAILLTKDLWSVLSASLHYLIERWEKLFHTFFPFGPMSRSGFFIPETFGGRYVSEFKILWF